MKDEPCLMLYVTAGNREEAERLAELLVEKRLAACVNILGDITSWYRWKGAVQKDAEVALVAKTTADRAEEAIGMLRKHHSYDVPCIVALPVTTGNPAFLSWVHDETRVIT